jgi:hypothetical protein
MSSCAVDGSRATAVDGADRGSRPKVLVNYEPCASGRRALAAGPELTDGGGELTIVTVAPQADPPCCRRGGTMEYNCAVREEAQLELREARSLMGATAARAAFKVLVERRDPPLGEWAAKTGFDVALLAAHRLTRGGNSYARKLRRALAAEVHVVA